MLSSYTSVLVTQFLMAYPRSLWVNRIFVDLRLEFYLSAGNSSSHLVSTLFKRKIWVRGRGVEIRISSPLVSIGFPQRVGLLQPPPFNVQVLLPQALKTLMWDSQGYLEATDKSRSHKTTLCHPNLSVCLPLLLLCVHQVSAASKSSSRYFAKNPALKQEDVRTATAIQLTTASGIQLKNKQETEVVFKR